MNKDQKLLAEAYNNIVNKEQATNQQPQEQQQKTVSSEAFQNSFCIFVERETAEQFNKAITQQGLKEKGVRVLKGTWAPDATACIVIPNKLDTTSIRDSLFQLPGAKKGFWPQYGMGYKGKTWEVVQ